MRRAINPACSCSLATSNGSGSGCSHCWHCCPSALQGRSLCTSALPHVQPCSHLQHCGAVAQAASRSRLMPGHSCPLSWHMPGLGCPLSWHILRIAATCAAPRPGHPAPPWHTETAQGNMQTPKHTHSLPQSCAPWHWDHQTSGPNPAPESRSPAPGPQTLFSPGKDRDPPCGGAALPLAPGREPGR